MLNLWLINKIDPLLTYTSIISGNVRTCSWSVANYRSIIWNLVFFSGCNTVVVLFCFLNSSVQATSKKLSPSLSKIEVSICNPPGSSHPFWWMSSLKQDNTKTGILPQSQCMLTEETNDIFNFWAKSTVCLNSSLHSWTSF